jgi:Fe-S oxidoreductase
MEPARSIEHGDIVHRCFRCGYCKFPGDYVDFNCPSYKAFGWDTYAPGGRMWLIRAWLNGELETSRHFGEILYSCSSCGNCTEHCVFPKFKDTLVNIFEETRAALVSEGKIPPKVRDYFKAVAVNGNPYKLPQNERGKWAEGTGIEAFSDQEYLFYVGCVGSYDEVGQKMARSVGSLLSRSGVSLGILGNEETCDGNEVRSLGETGLFKSLAEENIRKFKEKGVKKIIAMDPHALNAFKKDYPRLGGAFQVFHYTEILAGLIKKGKVSLRGYEARVTYHDPCYLGRHNGIFVPPRETLRAVPGLEAVEMRRNGLDGFCCGGGGGNFFTDIIGPGEDSPARVRAREAMKTGAAILAVACPQCAKMLGDAVKAEGKEDLEVLDIAEIVRRAQSV